MRNRSADLARSDVQALRHELREANDHKIRRVTAMLDGVSETAGKQAILDPLRDRLGSLKPVRPLRFARTLFIPLDPLIVPAKAWRPGDAAVPRSVLASLSAVVRAGLGPEAMAIDAMIAGHNTDAIQVITSAGAVLWPRAAEILDGSAMPEKWEETGLRAALYPSLATSVAAVLRRAPRLRCLSRDEVVGVLETDRQAIEDVLRNIAGESAEACAMITELLFIQASHAVPVLWQCMSVVSNAAEKGVLQRATARAMERVLQQMETQTGVMGEIARAPLAAVGEHVRRIASFLRATGDAMGAPVQRSRFAAIRAKLDQACRERFAGGLEEGLVIPLTAATGVFDGAGQMQLERCARELRTLESVARKVGGGGCYDELLARASDTVQAAGEGGRLTPVRAFRLIEILSGSAVAAALYKAARR